MNCTLMRVTWSATGLTDANGDPPESTVGTYIVPARATQAATKLIKHDRMSKLKGLFISKGCEFWHNQF